MNTKIETHRGGAFSLVETLIVTAIVALLATFLMPQTAEADNYNSYYVNTTNSVPIISVGTNQANVILANTTNYFNLSTTANQTNNPLIWPSCPLTKQDNMFNPSRALTHHIQSASMAANVGVWTERIAGSTDGSHWQTNPCPIVLSVTQTGTTTASQVTNYDSYGFQYLAIFSRENTNASVAITNTFDDDGFNRGL